MTPVVIQDIYGLQFDPKTILTLCTAHCCTTYTILACNLYWFLTKIEFIPIPSKWVEPCLCLIKRLCSSSLSSLDSSHLRWIISTLDRRCLVLFLTSVRGVTHWSHVIWFPYEFPFLFFMLPMCDVNDWSMITMSRGLAERDFPCSVKQVAN